VYLPGRSRRQFDYRVVNKGLFFGFDDKVWQLISACRASLVVIKGIKDTYRIYIGKDGGRDVCGMWEPGGRKDCGKI